MGGGGSVKTQLQLDGPRRIGKRWWKKIW